MNQESQNKQLEQIRELFGYLHRGSDVFYIANGGFVPDWHEGREEIRVPKFGDAYFPVHPPKAIVDSGRGGIENVAAINCLFTDIDAKDLPQCAEFKQRLEARRRYLKGEPGGEDIPADVLKAVIAEARREAKKYVQAFSIEPTVIVQSGTGYHCYWILKDTFVLDSDEALQTAQNAQASWVDFVGGDDNAKDLARTLRLPGTKNNKPEYSGANPPCRIVKSDYSKLYSLEELLAQIPDEMKQQKAQRERPAFVGQAATELNASLFQRMTEIQSFLAKLAPWRCHDRQSWFNVLCVIHEELGEFGRSIAHVWSTQDDKYDAADLDRVYDSLGNYSGERLTLASLRKWADEDAAKPTNQGGTWAFRPMFARDWLAKPKKEWLIEGVVGKQDLVMVYGDSGAGKTFVIYDLMASAITGKTFAEQFEVTKPLHVAYMTGEGQAGMGQRYRAVLDKFGFEDTEGRLIGFEDVPQLFDAKHAQYMDSFIAGWKALGRPLDLLVIDTLNTATIGANENDNSQMGQALDAAKRASKELGCAVIIVHHTNKAGTGERGASAIKASLDMTHEVKGEGRGMGRFIPGKNRDGRPAPEMVFSLESHLDSAIVQWNGNSLCDRLNETERAVIRALEDAEAEGKRLKASEISEAIGRDKKDKNIHAVLRSLTEKGRIRRELENPEKKESPHNPKVYTIERDEMKHLT